MHKDGGEGTRDDAEDGYWDAVAEEKTFSHPLDLARLERHAGSVADVLDLGCGYGRTCAELARLRPAWRVVGVDPSRAMVARGLRERPGLDLRVVPVGAPGPFADGTFDAVLLLAVLTSAPRDEDQERLVLEAARALRPGGVLVVSDLELQDDERHRARYAAGERELGAFGVFRVAGGGVCRHHAPGRLEALLSGAGLEPRERVEVDVLTMNGNPVRAVQLYASRG